MKIYLAGPMTGLPQYNYPMFHEVEECVKKVFPRAEVLSPARIEFDDGGIQGSLPYEEYMKAGYDLLLKADTICLLPGWSKSTGAKAELALALSLGYKVYYCDEYGEVAFIS